MVTEKTHSASKLRLFTVVLDFLFSASADKSLEADVMEMPRMDTHGTRHNSEGTLQFSEVPESTTGRFSVSLPRIILAGIICLHIPLQLWQSALSSTTDQSEIPDPACFNCLGSPCSEGGCALRVAASSCHGLLS